MTDEKAMALAIELAKEAAACGEVPVGCVILDADGNVIGRGRNTRQESRQVSAHAEMNAMHEACEKLGDWRLEGCTMYVTLEPCPMCAGAILNARLSRLCYGAKESLMGSCGSIVNIFMENYGFSPQIVPGILADDCAALLRDFFTHLRDKK